jgi:hypothetical protein
MTVDSVFDDQTHNRLNRIERELRCLRIGGVFALATTVVACLAAMADPPAKELRVETLRIVQRDGKDRIVLTAIPEIPDMTFYDPSGHARLTLDIANDKQPELAIAEAGKEKGRLAIGIDNGTPVLRLYDRAGKLRVSMGVPQDVGSLIRIFDEEGHVLARLP